MQAIPFDEPVTLLGAGPVSPNLIKNILPLAPRLVAADGGAATALQLGILPEYVIGDMDSLGLPQLDGLPGDRILRIAEQDSTDFEKCLSRIEAPDILALGFTGRRIDHELAVYNALVRYPDRRCLVLGSEDLVFAAPSEIMLDLPEGTRLSLFPMAPVTGQSRGLRWPIDGLTLAPGGRVGTSNVVTGPVVLSFDAPGMLVIMPRAGLEACRAGLRRSVPAR